MSMWFYCSATVSIARGGWWMHFCRDAAGGLVLLLVSGGAISCARTPADGRELNGDPELLQLVAAAHESNRERIQTWRGRAVVETRITSADADSVEERTASVEFFLDRERKAHRSNFLTSKSVLIAKGQTEPNVRPMECYLLKDGAYYEYVWEPHGDEVRNGPSERTVRIQEESARLLSAFGYDFDPMYWLTFGNTGVARHFKTHYKWAKEGQEFGPASVGRTGNLVKFEVHANDAMKERFGGDVVNEWIVDLSKGGNLLVYDSGGDQAGVIVPGVRWTYEHENVGGIWVPKRVAVETTSAGRTTRRGVEWVENVINEPIPEEEFSLVKLGARRGDRVRDSRTGAEYLLEGEQFPLPEPWDYGKRLERPWARIAMVGGTIALVVVLLLAGWRQWRKTKGDVA